MYVCVSDSIFSIDFIVFFLQTRRSKEGRNQLEEIEVAEEKKHEGKRANWLKSSRNTLLSAPGKRAIRNSWHGSFADLPSPPPSRLHEGLGCKSPFTLVQESVLNVSPRVSRNPRRVGIAGCRAFFFLHASPLNCACR